MRLSRRFGCIAFAALLSSPAWAVDGVGVVEDGVPSANQKNAVATTLIDPDFRTKLLAAGADPLENPSGIITNYGMLSDGTLTEPDENTYVVFPRNPGGPTANFDYGRHFLYQGHENGAPKAYVTRINLDVPRGDIHRITLLTPVDAATGTTGLGSIDGSTYNPFTRTLLFTQEAGSNGGAFQLTTGWPAQLTKLDAFLGKGGYEGIHADRFGNIYIIEDTGGATSSTTAPVNLNKGRQPNSFVYRFVPKNSNRIEDGGDLQALQVTVDGTPIVFGGTTPQQRDADISSTAQLKLHTPGTHYRSSGSRSTRRRLAIRLLSMPMLRQRRREQRRSSVRRIWPGCRAPTSGRSSLTPPATPTRSPEKIRSCGRVVPTARSSASISIGGGTIMTMDAMMIARASRNHRLMARFRCSCSVITTTTRSITLRSSTSASCSRQKTVATCCTPS